MRADKREARRVARRDEILDAAMQVVLEDGLEALTIARLARDLGVAGGALYRYFKGKTALVVGLQERAIESFERTLQASLEDAEARAQAAQASERVRALLAVATAPASYLAHGDQAAGLHHLIDQSLSDPRALLADAEARQVGASLASLLARVAQPLERAVASGALCAGETDVRTHLLWAAAHGLDHFRKRDRIQPEALKVPALLVSLLRDLFAGWGADSADVEGALRFL